MADEFHPFTVSWEERTWRRCSATVIATSKTAAARQVREGDLLTNVSDRRTSRIITTRVNVKGEPGRNQ